MPREVNEERIKERAAEIFWEDGDTMNALDAFARGLLGDSEFLQGMIFLRMIAVVRAEHQLEGPNPPDDNGAKEGTWDNSEEEGGEHA